MDYRFKNKNYLTFLSYKLSSPSIVIKLYIRLVHQNESSKEYLKLIHKLYYCLIQNTILMGITEITGYGVEPQRGHKGRAPCLFKISPR